MKLSIVLFAFLMTIRCGSGTPVEYTGVCDKANNEKRVQVVGYLDNDGSAMCSSGSVISLRMSLVVSAIPAKWAHNVKWKS